jgi:aerobic-type carbon monoxide dehydrogenase small subunit (CoxS/CutS family)
MSVTLKVNGKSVTVDAPKEMPLLWALRDVLDMKGTKYGCGISPGRRSGRAPRPSVRWPA